MRVMYGQRTSTFALGALLGCLSVPSAFASQSKAQSTVNAHSQQLPGYGADSEAAAAVASNAMPYHQALLRGQKSMQAYQGQAQEMSAAYQSLSQQAHALAAQAVNNQAMGYTVQAQ